MLCRPGGHVFDHRPGAIVPLAIARHIAQKQEECIAAYKFADHVSQLSRQDLGMIEHGRRRHRECLIRLSVARFARKCMVESSTVM